MRHDIKLKRHIFKLAYTKRRLEHVLSASTYILEQNLDKQSPVYFSLVSSIHCNYAALFTQNEGNLGAVTEKILGTLAVEQKALHKTIITLRNKVFAHVDPTIEGKFELQSEIPKESYCLNKVVILVKYDGREQEIQYGLAETNSLNAGILQIKTLVEGILTRIEQELKETLQKCFKTNTDEGKYEIDGNIFLIK